VTCVTRQVLLLVTNVSHFYLWLFKKFNYIEMECVYTFKLKL
jgi:hypothetical protein